MKTTLDLPDTLVKQVRLRALRDGRKLKEAVPETLAKQPVGRQQSLVVGHCDDLQSFIRMQGKEMAVVGNQIVCPGREGSDCRSYPEGQHDAKRPARPAWPATTSAAETKRPSAGRSRGSPL